MLALYSLHLQTKATLRKDNVPDVLFRTDCWSPGVDLDPSTEAQATNNERAPESRGP
jgi:hypothetical protein